MPHLMTARPWLLSLMILAGLAINAHRAHAGELRHIVVAGGCFWCVEADFEKVKGVTEAVSGYTGGTTENPTYKQVTRGGTGHYEAVRIDYDSGVVTRDELYHLFFRSVDPTDAGGQFCDRGDSYRTAIFVSNPAEKAAATRAKAEAEKALGRKIVTPILEAGLFYKAEAYHQDYYKGTKRVLTRFGAIRQADAYKRYRKGCKRDARIEKLWGKDAPFISG
ncbi:peptide-methionine (S)-S-oxide reductase MsrA [Aestuariicoccus sp. MJ-SS9]|uniref:peptide-methionine (S)-S-oxide reductase MsrA n=1 Tax=Aestuariicoccus sp. MJ-SS9 TaxID=3079855 RepID=UPI00290B1D12|nr:peptide-methionine (S)-S-oxide reductase MsrA [Aestuariicoccus sp. MJ-SS9]MDU8910897.1 peptide-methionine (S)-S-oxide reductase MsrA [Aestuariicoccus sp. MJ-SS9]